MMVVAQLEVEAELEALRGEVCFKLCVYLSLISIYLSIGCYLSESMTISVYILLLDLALEVGAKAEALRREVRSR